MREISSDKLKDEGLKQRLWFKGEESDLYITFEKNKIVHFEITLKDHHLEGGSKKPLKYGSSSNGEAADIDYAGPSFKGSRLITFENKISLEFVGQAIELIKQVEGLEKSIKDGLLLYLSSFGENDSKLLSEKNYQSFRGANK